MLNTLILMMQAASIYCGSDIQEPVNAIKVNHI